MIGLRYLTIELLDYEHQDLIEVSYNCHTNGCLNGHYFSLELTNTNLARNQYNIRCNPNRPSTLAYTHAETSGHATLSQPYKTGEYQKLYTADETLAYAQYANLASSFARRVKSCQVCGLVVESDNNFPGLRMLLYIIKSYIRPTEPSLDYVLRTYQTYYIYGAMFIYLDGQIIYFSIDYSFISTSNKHLINLQKIQRAGILQLLGQLKGGRFTIRIRKWRGHPISIQREYEKASNYRITLDNV